MTWSSLDRQLCQLATTKPLKSQKTEYDVWHGWKDAKIQRSVYVRSKGHIQREHPTPPWQESSCSSLKSEEVRRKSERKSVSSRGETEFSIQQDWRAGSTCHWLVGVQKGQRDRSGLDVRSIALDFGSADRTGSWFLACKEPRPDNKISQILLFLVRF